MAKNLRFQVVEEAFKKRALEVRVPSERPSEFFGKYVFTKQKMYKYLPVEVYDKMVDVMDNGQSAVFNQTNVAKRHNGYKFRCKVSNTSGTVYSDPAMLTVSSVAPVIVTQPSGVTAALGSTATFSVTASGTGMSYQWQYLKPGQSAWTNVTDNGQDAVFNQKKVAQRHNGYQFRCVVTNAKGSVTSSAVTLTVG